MNLSTNFDTDILGLKFVLIDFLGDEGFGWFTDYVDVDCCMSSSSISLTIACDLKTFYHSITRFNKKYGFFIEHLDKESGRFVLTRSNN